MFRLLQAVWQVNPNVPIARVRPMADFVRDSAGTRRFTLPAIQTLALTALLLAALGLYGVVSGNVTERVREIGIPRSRFGQSNSGAPPAGRPSPRRQLSAE